jgi:hypothetical protein
MSSFASLHALYPNTSPVGFLTTFVLLARDDFKPQEMVSPILYLLCGAKTISTELDIDQSFLWVSNLPLGVAVTL